MTQPPPRRGRRQPKTEAACAQLLRLAQSAGPGAQLPTFLELCKLFNVSKGTLDSALREMEQQQIIERRHGVGIFVCAGVYKPILLLIRDSYLSESNSSDPFWSLLMEQAHSCAISNNYEITVHKVSEATHGTFVSDEIRTLLSSKPWQGVLAFGVDVLLSEWIEDQGTPLIAFAGYAMNMVSIDSSYALRGGVWHLKELGCRNVGLWHYCASGDLDETGHEPTSLHQFRQALEANGYSFNPRWIKTFTQNDNVTLSIEQIGDLAARETYSSPDKPDGILISHDHLTRGLITGLEEIKLKIGEDVKVVTAANRGSSLLSAYEDCLILMEFDAQQIVQEMLDLLQALHHGEIPGGAHRYVRPIVKTPVRKESLS